MKSKQGKMIYLMQVSIAYLKNKQCNTSVRELVSVLDTPEEIFNSEFARNYLKSQVVNRSSAAFKVPNNFRVLKVLDKKQISRSFFYMED